MVARRNVERLGLSERSRIVVRDWRAALRHDRAGGRRYGLCLIDPPYSVVSRVAAPLVDLLVPVLEPGAIVVIESAADTPAPLAELPAAAREFRTYGDTAVSVIRLEPHT